LKKKKKKISLDIESSPVFNLAQHLVLY